MKLEWTNSRRKVRYRARPALYVVLFLLFLIIVLLLTKCSGSGGLNRTSPSPNIVSPTPQITLPPTPTALPTMRPVNADYRNVGLDARRISYSSTYIYAPKIWKNEMLFTAGSGLVNNLILRDLILTNLDTGVMTRIFSCGMSPGEILMPTFNDRWIVWVETNGKIYRVCSYLRTTRQSRMIIEIKSDMPKIALCGDVVVIQKRTAADTDVLLGIDLVNNSQTTWATYNTSSYAGVTAFGDGEWVAFTQPILNQLGEDTGKSVVTVRGFGKQDLVYQPGMFAYAPQCNSSGIAFFDRVTSPDAQLFYMTKDKKTIWIDGNVSSFAMGDGFILYEKAEKIWAYYIKTQETVVLCKTDEKGKLPVAMGSIASWNEWKKSKNGILYKVLIPEEVAPTTDPSKNPILGG